MTSRNWQVCILAALSSTFLTFPIQAAAPLQNLAPVSGWAITKIDGNKANNSAAYCTLTRQYDNGVMLTLGRNATEEYSLAVDFQKNRFDVDQPYKLTLQPGPGQVRAFEMMPISDKAMVVRLGWDETFFDALQKSKSLKLGISGDEYAFSLPDIQSGQKDLASCMDGLKNPVASTQQVASAEQPVDVLKAEPVQADQNFAARKVTSADEQETAKAPEPAKEIIVAEKKPEPVLVPVPAPAVVKAPTPVVVADNSAAIKAEMNQKVSALKADNDALTAQLTAAQKQITDLSVKAAKPAVDPAVTAQMKTLQDDLAKTRADMAKVMAERDAALKVKTASEAVSQKVSVLEQDLAARTTALAAAQKTLAEKDAALAAAKTTADTTATASQERSALAQKVSMLEQASATQKAALDAAQKTLNEKQAQLTAAQAQAAAPKTDTAQITTLQQQVALYKSEAEKARLELNALQSSNGARVDQSASLKLQMEKLRNQLALKEGEARTYRNQLAAIQTQPSPSAMNAVTPAAGMVETMPEVAQKPVTEVAVRPAAYQPTLSGTLNNAGMALTKAVARVPSSANNEEIYTWKTANLFGRAEVVSMQGSSDLKSYIAQHVETARARCGGDFAAMPSRQSDSEAYYEVACVLPSGNTSASIYFYEDQGRFIAVSHETVADDMDIAMDARDRVAKAVR